MLWFFAVPVWGYFVFHDLLIDHYTYPRGVVDWMFTLLLGILSTIFGGLPCAAIAGLLGFFFESHAERSAHCALVSLRDKDGVAARFFLGSGEITGEPYYFFYKKLNDGSFRPGKVRANESVRIYEEDREDATMTEFVWELNKWWAYLVAFPHNTESWACEFHVPKGTIRTGYTM